MTRNSGRPTFHHAGQSEKAPFVSTAIEACQFERQIVRPESLPMVLLLGHGASIVIWIAPAATGRTIHVSVTGRLVARTSASAYRDNCPPCSMAI